MSTTRVISSSPSFLRRQANGALARVNRALVSICTRLEAASRGDCYLRLKLPVRYPAEFSDFTSAVVAFCMPSGSQLTDLSHFRGPSRAGRPGASAGPS